MRDKHKKNIAKGWSRDMGFHKKKLVLLINKEVQKYIILKQTYLHMHMQIEFTYLRYVNK